MIGGKHQSSHFDPLCSCFFFSSCCCHFLPRSSVCGTEPVGLRDFQGMKESQENWVFQCWRQPSSLVWNVLCPRFEPGGFTRKTTMCSTAEPWRPNKNKNKNKNKKQETRNKKQETRNKKQETRNKTKTKTKTKTETGFAIYCCSIRTSTTKNKVILVFLFLFIFIFFFVLSNPRSTCASSK